MDKPKATMSVQWDPADLKIVRQAARKFAIPFAAFIRMASLEAARKVVADEKTEEEDDRC